MSKVRKLSASEVSERLGSLNGWSEDQQKLHKEFMFQNFVEAFSFMTAAALYAEKLDHHPEWFNVFNRVVVELTTHDCEGISELDFELAQHMDRLAE